MRNREFHIHFDYGGKAYDRDCIILRAGLGSKRYEEAIMRPVELTWTKDFTGDDHRAMHEIRRYETIALNSFAYVSSGLEELEDYREGDGYPSRFVQVQERRRYLAMLMLVRFDEEERREWLMHNRGIAYKFNLIAIHRAYNDCQSELHRVRNNMYRAMDHIRHEVDRLFK